jgi:hypothetical protein
VHGDYAEVFMPPSDGMSRAQRFAYALLEPPAAAPVVLLRRALEQSGGNPVVGLTASDYGALFLIFRSPEERERAMERFPLSVDGHCIRLERPEDGWNRYARRLSSFTHVSATGFPLEHWDERGIRMAFRSIGQVSCVDPLCLDELDFSTVRVVLKLEKASDVPAALLVRDALGGELCRGEPPRHSRVELRRRWERGGLHPLRLPSMRRCCPCPGWL